MELLSMTINTSCCRDDAPLLQYFSLLSRNQNKSAEFVTSTIASFTCNPGGHRSVVGRSEHVSDNVDILHRRS